MRNFVVAISKLSLVISIYFFAISPIFSQCNLTGPDPRDCGYSCTSNDVTLNGVYLQNSTAPDCITDLTATYTADLCFSLTNNAGSSRFYTLAADFVVNGIHQSDLMHCFGEIPGGETVEFCLSDFLSWTGGDAVALQNIWGGWAPPSGGCQCTNGSCGNYIPPGKCNDSIDDIVIPTPPAVAFDWDCGPTSRNIQFNNLSTGGTEPIQYHWDFGDGNTSTEQSPAHTYADKNEYNVTLTVTDGEGRVCSFEALATPASCCEFYATCNLANVTQQGCSVADAPAAYTDFNDVFTSVSTIPCGDLILLYNDVELGGTGCASDPFVIERTYTLYDDCNFNGSQDTGELSETCIHTISIADTNPPVIQSFPSDMSVECDGLGNTTALNDWLNSSASATATDDCGSLTWSNDFTELIEGCGGTASATVNFIVSDDCGNSVSAAATFSIIDTTPPGVSEGAADPIVECDGAGNTAELDAWLSGNGGLSATDDCSTFTWSYQLLEVDLCQATSQYIAEFTVTDDCGNATVVEKSFTIEDTQAPAITQSVQDLSVECDEIPEAIILYAFDVCVGEMEAFPTDNIINATCANEYTIERTWQFIDDCQNVSSTVQLIHVTDSTPPVLTAVPGDLTFSCSDEIFFEDNVSATDNCTSNLQMLYDEEYLDFDAACPYEYSVLRTWTAIDECGNSTSLSQVIEVFDNELPQMVANIPQNVYAECEPPAVEFSFADNCDNDLDITITETIPMQTCPSNYIIAKTWEVSDCSGNYNSGTVFIHVEDNTPPQINFTDPLLQGLHDGAVLEYECSLNDDGTYALPAFDTSDVFVSDNCGPFEVTLSDNVISEGTCVQDGYQLLVECIFEAVDECGNYSSLSFYLKVVDNTPPVFTDLPPAYMEASCNDVPEPYDVKAADECICVHTDVQETYNDNNTVCVNDDVIERVYSAVDHCGNYTSFTQTIAMKSAAPQVEHFEPFAFDVSQPMCREDYNKITAVVSDGCGMVVDSYYDEYVINSFDCDLVEEVRRIYRTFDQCGNEVEQTFDFLIVQEDYQLSSVLRSDNPFLHQVIMEGSAPEEGFRMYCSDNLGENEIRLETLAGRGQCASVLDIRFMSKTEELAQCNDGVSSVTTYFWDILTPCGSSRTITMPVHFIDDVAPELEFEAEATMKCGEEMPEIVAKDACGIPNLQITEIEHTTNCSVEKLIERRITCSDNCSNVTEAVQFVRVLPNEPVFSLEENACAEDGVPTEVRAWHPCYPEHSFTATLDRTEHVQDCYEGSTHTQRVWVATNACGSRYEYVQDVFGNDNSAPVIHVDQFESEIRSGYLKINDTDARSMDMLTSIVEEEVVRAVDNCGTNEIEVTLNVDTLYLDCLLDGVFAKYSFEWIAEDACGNVSELKLDVEVDDTVAPVILNAPADDTYFCEEDAAIVELEIEEANSYEIEFTEEINGSLIVRTWVVTDGCGNQTTHVQNVVYSPFVCAIEAPQNISCNSSITMNVDVEGGLAPYEIQWNSDSGDCYISGPSNGSSVNLVTGFLPSTISVAVTDATGCQSICEFDMSCSAHGFNDTDNIDIDLDFVTGDVTEEVLDFKAYPIPVIEDLIIENYGLDFIWTIYSVDGKEVKSGSVRGSSSAINLSELSAGYYTLTATNGQLHKVVKIFKQ